MGHVTHLPSVSDPGVPDDLFYCVRNMHTEGGLCLHESRPHVATRVALQCSMESHRARERELPAHAFGIEHICGTAGAPMKARRTQRQSAAFIALPLIGHWPWRGPHDAMSPTVQRHPARLTSDRCLHPLPATPYGGSHSRPLLIPDSRGLPFHSSGAHERRGEWRFHRSRPGHSSRDIPSRTACFFRWDTTAFVASKRGTHVTNSCS